MPGDVFAILPAPLLPALCVFLPSFSAAPQPGPSTQGYCPGLWCSPLTPAVVAAPSLCGPRSCAFWGPRGVQVVSCGTLQETSELAKFNPVLQIDPIICLCSNHNHKQMCAYEYTSCRKKCDAWFPHFPLILLME